MGASRLCDEQNCEPLLQIREKGIVSHEGMRMGYTWGTSLHGFFESAATRQELCQIAKATPIEQLFRVNAHKQNIYRQMAELLEEHPDLGAVFRYVGISFKISCLSNLTMPRA